MVLTEKDIRELATGERILASHPGETLLEDFLLPLGMTKNALATAIGVPATRIGEIVRGTRAITADTDIRLSRYFGTEEGWWLALQAIYDLDAAHRRGRYDSIPRYVA